MNGHACSSMPQTLSCSKICVRRRLRLLCLYVVSGRTCDLTDKWGTHRRNLRGNYLPTFTHVSGNMQTKAKYPYEDMGFFGIVAIGEEERAKNLKLRANEWDIMRACLDRLVEHNVFVRMYKTSLESVYERTKQARSISHDDYGEHDTNCQLLPYAHSAQVQTHDNKLISKELGHTDAALLTADLSAHTYHKIAAQLEAKPNKSYFRLFCIKLYVHVIILDEFFSLLLKNDFACIP